MRRIERRRKKKKLQKKVIRIRIKKINKYKRKNYKN
jgi:hypothetical protein